MNNDKKANALIENSRPFSWAWQILIDSFGILEKRFWALIIISFIGSVSFVGVMIGVAYAINSIVVSAPTTSVFSRFVFFFLATVLSILSGIMQIWSGIALLTSADSDNRLGVINSYRVSKTGLGAYAWSGFLGLAVVCAGLAFLIIPGIIMFVWLSLASVTAAIENKQGLDALFASRELIKNRWRKTALFLALASAIALAITYAAAVLSLPSIFQSLFIYTFTGSFFAASLLALYHRLKQKQGIVNFDNSQKRRQKYAFLVFTGAATMIAAIVILIFFGIKFGNDSFRFLEAKSTQQALLEYNQKQGAFPHSLSQLVPDYLPALPVDPASRKTLDYAPNDDGKDYVLIINFDNLGAQTLTSHSSMISGEK